MDKLGEKSAQNLLNALENSKTNPLYRLINGLGIRHIGEKAAKILAKKYKTTISDIVKLNDIQDPDYIVAGEKLIIPGRAIF